MTDEGTEEEPRSLSGEIEPSEPGVWLTLDEAGERLGINRKAVYRRIRRGSMTGKKAPNASHLLVWFPEAPPPVAEEPRSLAVPDAPERLALVIEQATAPLVSRIEELIRENERLRIERERRSLWGELWERIRRRLGYN